MALEPTKRRFTTIEYHQMGRAGIFGEDDRVELLDGEVIQMTPIGRRHAAGVRRLNHLFTDRFRGVALVGVQNPIQLSEFNEPQPDLVLLRPRPDFYASGHPTPADVLLIVEIVDTTGSFDRRVKIPLYAESGIPEVWFVDLSQDGIAVYHDPSPGGFRTVRVFRRGEALAPLAFPDRPLAVADILG